MIAEIANVILAYAIQFALTPGDAGQVLRVLPYTHAPSVARTGLVARALEFNIEFSSTPGSNGDMRLWEMRHVIASGAESCVSVAGEDVTEQGIAILVLATSLPWQRLDRLDLRNNQLGPDRAAALAANLPRLSSLTALTLSFNGLRADGATAIAPYLPALLTALNLSGNAIGPEGTHALASAFPPALRTLDLSTNAIGDIGAQAIAAHWPRTLTQLNLAYNHIGEVGARALAAHLRTSSVTDLRLPSNRIGDAGAQAIADNFPAALATLYLSNNGVSDPGGRAIASALPLSVTELVMGNNQVSGPGKDAIRRAWGGRSSLCFL